MSMLRPYPIDGDNNAYLANVGNTVNNQTLYGGKGINIRKSPNGTHISVTALPRKDNVTNRQVYDFNQEYFPNDVVFIDPSTVYTDETGNPINGLGQGSYICINHVPAAVNSSSFFINAVVPAYNNAGASVNDDMANSYRWYSYNNYYPCNTKFSSSITSDVSGYNIVCSQSYWQQLSSAPTYGNWDENAAYSVGDEVWIDPNNGYSISFTSSAGGPPPLVPGTFRCIIPVPDTGSRTEYNYYYPFYPSIPTGSVTTVSGSLVNQTYWGPVAPMIQVTNCVNGQNTQMWVGGVIPGAYIYTLPYTGD